VKPQGNAKRAHVPKSLRFSAGIWIREFGFRSLSGPINPVVVLSDFSLLFCLTARSMKSTALLCSHLGTSPFQSGSQPWQVLCCAAYFRRLSPASIPLSLSPISSHTFHPFLSHQQGKDCLVSILIRTQLKRQKELLSWGSSSTQTYSH
jgi:hypothetical protein